MVMDERNSYAVTTVLVFGLGAAAGAALGMLYAPASGRKIRDRFGRRIRETTESARDLKGRLMQKGEEALRNGEQALSEVSRKARETVSRLSASASHEP